MYVVKLLVAVFIESSVLLLCTSGTLCIAQRNSAVTKTQPNSIEMLLAAIQREHSFSTLVFWRREPADCFAELTSWNSPNYTAKLSFNASYAIYLNAHYNRAILNVVCLDDFVDLNLLDNMADGLLHMRETRVLFLLKNVPASQPFAELEELFTYCDQEQLLNVLAIRKDFATTGLFYSFNRFPNFTIEHVQWPDVYYPNRIKDLHGFALRTMPSQAEPGSIIYTDRRGKKQSLGYIYHLISTYAVKLNASLTYRMPVNVGASIEVSILADLTSNYDLDFPICLQMPVENMSLYGFSGVVEIGHWMPMLPRAGYIERYQIYKYVFSSNTLILDVIIFIIFSLLYARIANGGRIPRRSQQWPNNEMIFNDKIFRGVVGLSFKLRRERNYKFYLLYFLIFVQGIIWSTVYSAHLNASFNQPPAGEQINSYDDLKARNIQIAIPQGSFELLEKLMPESFMREYKDIFLIMSELRDYYAIRKSLDTKFAYSVYSETWEMVARRQRYFSQRLFRISDSLEFHQQILLAVPLAENSVYRASFNAYLLDMHAYGMWHHWTTMSLFEMVKAGKLNFEDLTKPRSCKAIQLWDLYYIWLIYIFGNAIGCMCVVAEVLHKKFLRDTVLRDCKEYFISIWNEFKDQFT
ncbi:PREDICTED: uncharacterized protein LOC108358380 [Rhagoletis zephyria]|uniref:uncharacterized protein LOC108358380 n=1 Tax=Rhagoletis zephyria TaxID=28612 RepID=UPI0008114019|nr:PREDICTED: uncharacterized protein LOC108358380 [Rhagoletis zephyria]